jgi:signal transduction histidine kinase
VIWTVRAAVIVACVVSVGLATDTGSARSVAAAAVAGLATLAAVVWAVLDLALASRRQRVPYVIAVITGACGVAVTLDYSRAAAMVGVALVAMLAAGNELPPRAAAAAGVVGVVATVATWVAAPVGLWPPALYLTLLGFGFLSGWHRRRLRDEQARAATLEERNRIAREIHDLLAHTLGGLDAQVRAARALLAAGEVNRAAAMLERAQRLTGDGLVEARRAVRALRADTPPLPTVLADLAAAHCDGHRTPVRVTVRGPGDAVPPPVALALTRVAQESLTNAARHAPGQPVDIVLDAGETVRLTVTNPLPAAAPASGGAGFGLVGMRERLALLDGTLAAGEVAGDEPVWAVDVRVPR